jgi:hypothetical protein
MSATLTLHGVWVIEDSLLIKSLQTEWETFVVSKNYNQVSCILYRQCLMLSNDDPKNINGPEIALRPVRLGFGFCSDSGIANSR